MDEKHELLCFSYEGGPCDCGLDTYPTDEEIDDELFERQMAKE